MASCSECGRQIGDDELVEGLPGTDAPGGEPPDAASPGTGPQDRCPACGTVVAPAGEAAEEEEVHVKAPWHFKVLVVGTVVYLGYRLYQGIGWLIHHA
jgi:hypothetical protein